VRAIEDLKVGNLSQLSIIPLILAVGEAAVSKGTLNSNCSEPLVSSKQTYKVFKTL
jgi:hypothetical protein